MTPNMWPILEFILAFGLGLAVGSSDVIRRKAGIPAQTPNHRSTVILQGLGIVMLILVGSTTYEQHRDSVRRQLDADCQAARNNQFSDGIAARAAAQTAFTRADEAFTDADEVWVAAQVQWLDAIRNRTLSQPERDRVTDEYRQALVTKQISAQRKQEALRDLDQARTDNPVNPPGNC